MKQVNPGLPTELSLSLIAAAWARVHYPLQALLFWTKQAECYPKRMSKLIRKNHGTSQRAELPTWRRVTGVACVLILMLALPERGQAYSVMSHQAIIDAAWESDIKPAIRQRFPNATEEEINRGQAYAYGGAIIQDLGYYPYGNPFFSDLTHYVRSADFIFALLRDAQDVYEYSFALGAMAHYAADNQGHRIGTNRAVPVLYSTL